MKPLNQIHLSINNRLIHRYTTDKLTDLISVYTGLSGLHKISGPKLETWNKAIKMEQVPLYHRDPQYDQVVFGRTKSY